MKIEKPTRKVMTRKGFALIIAICGVFVMSITGVTLHTTTMAEVWDSGQTANRARTRMGFGAALEHTRAVLPDFVRTQKTEGLLSFGTEDFTYTVNLNRIPASRFDPLASQLGAGDSVFLAEIQVRSGRAEGADITARRHGRYDERSGTAVIDSATGHRILFVTR